MLIRTINEKDLPEIRRFVRDCGSLGIHTLYSYWVLQEHFTPLCLVGEIEGAPAGLVTGIKSLSRENTAFLWQIAVHPAHRGKGLGRQLISAFAAEAKARGLRTIEFSIAPGNRASKACFQSCARSLGRPLEEIKALSLYDDLEGVSENEILYRISL